MDFRRRSGQAGGMDAEPGVIRKQSNGASGGRKRRRWPEAERRRIVEETLAPGTSVARVARAHGVNANQVFAWRRLYKQGRLGSNAPNQLLPVKVGRDERALVRPALTAEAGEGNRAAGVVQIVRGKTQIRIEGAVDRETLRLVLRSVLR